MNSFYEMLNLGKDELNKYRNDVVKRLGRLKYKGTPKCHIRMSVKKNQIYLVQKNSKEKYLTAKQHVYAEQIATFEYLNEVLKNIDRELKQIDSFLRKRSSSPEDYYESLSKGRQKLIVPIRLTDEQYVESWLNEPYEGSSVPFGDTEFYTGKEERVRSKSEILIANALAKHNVPYKYEYPVFTEELGVIHPDFTALNVKKRKQLYWEHLGKMDDESYVRDNTYRINVYEKNGMFLGDDLIITWETVKMSLDVKLVDQLIRHYLL